MVEVTGLADPGRDGITIQLPDVTNFAPVGRIDGTAPDARLTARAMSGGHTIGTMSLQRRPDGYEVAAAFTGDGNEGTYRVQLYRGDRAVGTIGGIANGDPVMLPRYLPIWWYWWIWWEIITFWNVQRESPTGDTPGECVWSLSLGAGDEVQVQTDEGTVVVADRIELHEDVRRDGSYPYLTFDRMDYLLGSGRMLLTGGTIANRTE